MAKSAMERRRSFFVSDALWDVAKAKSDNRNENLSEVLRRALEKYIESE